MRQALPLLHQQRYEAFQQLLGQVAQTIAQGDSALLYEPSTVVQAKVADLQQFFRQQILCLPLDILVPSMQHWMQSYQVECDKQLRLLGLDVMSLRAARQPTTIAQRQQQVSDRLSTLQRYCAAVLEGSRE
ncbi:MAG: heterocyst frequency control protein PatD [Stenomitos rutilans HA7619-LM2]|jgi:hypothetical protein|nr:heterocyst frequency control protein PatD [Stenomitos rutilans HA7619-LM2]